MEKPFVVLCLPRVECSWGVDTHGVTQGRLDLWSILCAKSITDAGAPMTCKEK